jgi:hypothetical protein
MEVTGLDAFDPTFILRFISVARNFLNDEANETRLAPLHNSPMSEYDLGSYTLCYYRQVLGFKHRTSGGEYWTLLGLAAIAHSSTQGRAA